jgi:hypothetical protein
MLELHKFVWALKEAVVAKESGADAGHLLVRGGSECMRTAAADRKLSELVPVPLIGLGPFVLVRLGTENVVESFGAGLMFGFRKAESDVSLNLGLALVTDPNARTLGDGVEEGKPLPAGETSIRYKTGHQEGLSLLFSVGW